MSVLIIHIAALAAATIWSWACFYELGKREADELREKLKRKDRIIEDLKDLIQARDQAVDFANQVIREFPDYASIKHVIEEFQDREDQQNPVTVGEVS